MKVFLPILIFVTAFALSGCSTVSSRSEEKSAVFNALDPQTQTRLKQSIIRLGDTPDMVYIALGPPSRVRENTTATGHDEVWIYTAHWQEYDGPYFAGYRHHAYLGRNARRYYYEPLREDLYYDREEEYLRVTFQENKATAIEQMKR